MSCSVSSKRLCGSVTCGVCIPRSFASHPRAAEWSAKNPMRPEAVFRSSNKKFLFDCAGCGHELSMTPGNISSGNLCIYCNRGKLCGSPNCTFCWERSMASHPMGEMWSEQNVLLAHEVSRGNDKKFWFRCKDCEHEYDVVPYSMKGGKHCPFCTSQALCDEEDCKECYEKSCSSHEGMREEWSLANEKTPRQVFLQSSKKYMFDCRKCRHTYTNTSSHYYNRGRACPYCANIKLCENECMTCFNKSFASHPRMVCWSPKNTLNPRMTFKGSDKRAIFICDVCQMEFDSKLCNILSGYFCGGCKNKSESKVLTCLREEYPNFQRQLRYDWCRFSKTNNVMPFDFGLEEEKILVELDGVQYFEQVSNWDSPDNVKAKDIEKMKKAVEAGYSVIHIFQPEVWLDEYDWKTVLKEQIEQLKVRKGEKARCMFISRRDIYGEHIQGVGESVVVERVKM